MARKIRPDSFRLGIIKNWQNRWFLKRSLNYLLEEDYLIRQEILKRIIKAGIASIEIERTGNSCKIFIKAARPGLIIGRGGKGVEDLKKAIEMVMTVFRSRKKNKEIPELNLDIEELKRSETSAQVEAQNIAFDLERRLRFRRVMKQHLDAISQNKTIKGAKIRLAGRLDGAEIARKEWLAKGRMPLTNLRADIDYGEATAFTTFGTIGVKTWIYKGDVFGEKIKSRESRIN
ncbi:MAG: 30S ribosomal protein S3 [Patescibacteria group bacterium]